MAKIYIPTKGPKDWKALLAEPDKHWKTGYSAKAFAYCWEEAEGFPETVQKVFSEAPYPIFKGLAPLLAIPEYQVPLPGGSRPSQTDLFVLAHSDDGLVTIAVEGKVEEAFGPRVSEWMENQSQGKKVRLQSIREQLGLERQNLDHIRYQLLHRTASALIVAKWFKASDSVMLVHSFSQNQTGFEDYKGFLSLFDRICEPDSVTLIGKKGGVDLYFAWVTGEEKYLHV